MLQDFFHQQYQPLRIRNFPHIPILEMGCFDHQSYSKSGGVWILRVSKIWEYFFNNNLPSNRHIQQPILEVKTAHNKLEPSKSSRTTMGHWVLPKTLENQSKVKKRLHQVLHRWLVYPLSLQGFGWQPPTYTLVSLSPRIHGIGIFTYIYGWLLWLEECG